MADDDETFGINVTGGYNPGTKQFFLNMDSEGVAIRIEVEDLSNDENRLKLLSMLDDLPAVAKDLTSGLLGQIGEEVTKILKEMGGEIPDSGVEAPRATIYTPGSLDG